MVITPAKYGSTGFGCPSRSWSAKQAKQIFPALVRAWGFGLARRVRPFHPARSFSTHRPNLVLTHGISPDFRDGVNPNRQPPSGRSRLYRVTHTQLRTDDVYRRESLGTTDKASRPQDSSNTGHRLFFLTPWGELTLSRLLCAPPLFH